MLVCPSLDACTVCVLTHLFVCLCVCRWMRSVAQSKRCAPRPPPSRTICSLRRHPIWVRSIVKKTHTYIHTYICMNSIDLLPLCALSHVVPQTTTTDTALKVASNSLRLLLMRAECAVRAKEFAAAQSFAVYVYCPYLFILASLDNHRQLYDVCLTALCVSVCLSVCASVVPCAWRPSPLPRTGCVLRRCMGWTN